ncbi:MAG: purine-binding chemotaxis protein CheW [Peptococcaceae bacterium]|nr:purine-binding chemotaxis protein CheW [Peptococcaceae bacterium]
MNNEEQLVIFELNSQHYALPIQETQEIIRMTSITRVPNTSHYIEGIINLRGRIVPVINLNKRLNLPVTEYDDDTRVIVVEHNGQQVGMIVDNVHEVGKLSGEEIEPPSVAGEDVGYLKGVVKKGENLWLLLNLDEII